MAVLAIGAQLIVNRPPFGIAWIAFCDEVEEHVAQLRGIAFHEQGAIAAGALDRDTPARCGLRADRVEHV